MASSAPANVPASAANAKPDAAVVTEDTGRKELYPMVNWKYDVFSWCMSILIDLFFREVHPRGSWKVPKSGPVLFVAAPHANQFVDGIVLQRTLRQEAGRRVSLLIAQKSVHGFIGWGSRQTGSVPVGRAQDHAKPASGTIYLPDPIGDPTLVRGIGTRFGDGEGVVGGLLFLPAGKKAASVSVDIAEIISHEEIRLRRPLKGKLSMQQLTGRDDVDDDGHLINTEVRGPKPGYEGTKFKLAPHIDQTVVYHAVFDRLKSGGCVGIFPEGGSHDRTELLPLKAGVAIMALGALAEAPDCGLTIVPVGMNYFHAHKFRSRAVVEFGPPIEVPSRLVSMYKNNERRDAIGQLLDTIYQGLSSVTVSTPDYDTLMLIQAARRLYNPSGTSGKKLPLPVVVELNRRLAMGYERYKDDERIKQLMAAVRDYNSRLRHLNLRDHQVQYATMSLPTVLFTFVYRVLKLLVLFIAVMPGLVLFSPVFIATKVISLKKAKEALAGSSVKIQGKDVIATWKLLVALALAPTLYNFYSILITFKVYQDRFWGYAPTWMPLWLVFISAWIALVAITFASLRFGEVGMDIFKSLRPLFLCLFPSSSYSMANLRERRSELSTQVTGLINELGPEMFPDFARRRLEAADKQKQKKLEARPLSAGSGASSPPSSHIASPDTVQTLTQADVKKSSRLLPRNDSFSNIGGHGMFSTRPPSRSRSRSSSVVNFGGFTTLDSKDGFDEATRKIHEAMKLRRRKSSAKMLIVSDDDDSELDEGQEESEENSVEAAYNEARKKTA
ncbi:hypothetical protein TD95_003075 [Thielaviopsis punctulata]|uniref:Phospholipid/glycerol acyltransferase domain-containing protein n=1 Tax=Thielaviopsis punctulata TaxID=72032 RepID=A0A0F4ZFM5_9PEZI|nr:hypothetical protein TD95_003075 [Thielaviopsis punctulata]